MKCDFFRYNSKYNRLEKSLNQIVKWSNAGDLVLDVI